MIRRFVLVCTVFMLGLAGASAYGNVFHVKTAGNDNNDGLTWETAFATVTRAVAVAQDGDEVRVAAGTYRESIGVDRAITLSGGYPAQGGDARDYVRNVTVLDGGGVERVIGCWADAVIDGFTIMHGNSDGAGGIHIGSSSFQIRNCTLSENYGKHGGGIDTGTVWSDIEIINCTFYKNTSTLYGGGGLYIFHMPSFNCTLKLSGCSFIENSVEGKDFDGGAVAIRALGTGTMDVDITNCLFYGNSASASGGGGIFFYALGELLQMNISGCTFTANTAGCGGAICGDSYSSQCPLIITNSTFYKNSAENRGGAIYTATGTTITNCTFIDNETPEGIFDSFDSNYFNATDICVYSGGMYYGNGFGSVTNSIFWNTSGKYAISINRFKEPQFSIINCAMPDESAYDYHDNYSSMPTKENVITISDWLANHSPSQVTINGVTHTVFPLNSNDISLINGGTSTNAPSFDQLGNPRNTSAPSIGAVEYDPDNEGIYQFQGHKYKLFTEPLTWQEAKARCEALGGHLATITTAAENSFVAGLVTADITQDNGGVWLGASWTNSSDWQWVTGEAMSFTDWLDGQPDCSGGNGIYGLHVWHNSGGWAAYFSENVWLRAQGYICEWDGTVNTANITLEAFESSNGTYDFFSPNYNIIRTIETSRYLDPAGFAIDEHYIAPCTSSTNGKTGLTADGNTRLILRARSDTPGKIRFYVDSALGFQIERLNDREKSPEYIPTTPITVGGNTIYQASAVLIAPQDFPSSLAFPKDTFTVKATFTNDTGTSSGTKTLTLTLYTPPVVLIHGRTSSVRDTFGTKDAPFAVRKKLQDMGVIVEECDYNGYQGPEKNITSPNNNVNLAVSSAMDNLRRKGIACTKVDILAHSMGGLMARQFLRTDIDTGCIKAQSYGQACIRRIITIATPHNGSECTNYLLYTGPIELINSFKPIRPAWSLVRTLFGETKKFGSNLDYEEDLYELGVGSQFLIHLQEAEAKGHTVKVPMYALYGKIKEQLGTKIDVVTGTTLAASLLWGDFMTYCFALAFDMTLIGAYKGFNVMFQNEDYDIAVSEGSATYGFDGYCIGYEGADYIHTKISLIGEGICNQPDVGNRVLLLLSGPQENFRDGTAYQTVYATSTIPPANVTASDDTEAAIMERFTLKASANSITAGDGKTITYTSTFPAPLSNDAWLVFRTDREGGIARVAEAGASDFSFALEVSSMDSGIMDVRLFSYDSADNTILTSNIEPLYIVPDISGEIGLAFGANTIFTNTNSSQDFRLYVETSDGRIIDAMLWSNDISLNVGDTSIATVSGKRTVVGVREGTTTLTAAYKTLSASVEVSVAQAETEPEDESEPPTITTKSLSRGRVNSSYSTTLKATGTSPISWDITEGTLPDGLSLNTSGKISGKPSTRGKFTFTVRALNVAGNDSRKFTITITQPTSPVEPPSRPDTLPDKTESEDIPADKPDDTPSNEQPDSPINPPSKPDTLPEETESEDIPAPKPDETPPDNNNDDPAPDTSEALHEQDDSNTTPEVHTRAVLSIGRIRNAKSLSELELSEVSNDNTIIAAILPELRANHSGTYDIHSIRLDAGVPVGLPIIWNSFAKTSETEIYTADTSSSAVFLNDYGDEISSVPDTHRVHVSAVLEAGKIYAPVISVQLPYTGQDDDEEQEPETSEGHKDSGSGGCNSCASVFALFIAVKLFRCQKQH